MGHVNDGARVMLLIELGDGMSVACPLASANGHSLERWR